MPQSTGSPAACWPPGSPRATGWASGARLSEWTLTQYATARVGIILVNINPAYRTHELSYAINQSGLRMLVCADVFKTSDYPAMVEQVRGDCPGLEAVAVIGRSSWQDLLDAGAEVDQRLLATIESGLRVDDPINIQYTSGTTGFPKGATLSHRNIVNNGYFVTETIGFTEQDRLVIPVPFYHCFGMVMGNLGCTTHGATMIIPGPTFEPEAALRAVQTNGRPHCTACRPCSSPSRTSTPSAAST